MWIYRLKAFFESRLGQITIFTFACIGLMIFLGSYLRKRQQEKDQTQSALPSLSDNALWTDPEVSESSSEHGDTETFTHTEPNPSFVPAKPIIPKPIAVIEPKQVSVVVEEIPSHVGAVFPLPPMIPMILSERTVEPSPEKGPVMLPKAKPEPPHLDAEEGSLLYCVLTAPVSSDQKDAPVQARLTRPLIQRGRKLLPSGASLIGSLQRIEGNRVFLGSGWRVRLSSGEWVEIKAHAQEASFDNGTKLYTASDGRAGLPTILAPTQSKNTNWKDALGTVVKAAGNLGQDRTKTAIGEFVPGTARNTLIRGSSDLIESYTAAPQEPGQKTKITLKAEAGQRFYLYVTGE